MTNPFFPSTGGGGSSGTTTADISPNSILKIRLLLNELSIALNNKLGGKITTAYFGILDRINFTSNGLAIKLNSVNNNVVNAINNQSYQTRLKVSNATNEIKNSLNNTEFRIRNDTKLHSINILNSLQATENRIIGSLSGLGFDTQDEIKQQTQVLNTRLAAIKLAIDGSLDGLPDDFVTVIRQSGIIQDIVTIINDNQPQSDEFSLDFVGGILSAIGNFIGFDDVADKTGGINELFSKLARNEYSTWQDLRDDMDDLFIGNTVLSIMLRLGISVSMIWSSMFAIGKPFAMNIEKLSAASAVPNELSPDQLLSLWMNRAFSTIDFKNRMKEIGYSDSNAEDYIKLTRKQLNENELRELFFRGELNRQELEIRLTRLGIESDIRDEVLKVWEITPSPSDIVNFAVKDIYDSEVVDEFGLNSEIQQEYLDDAWKTGLNEEWAKKLWASHWRLPSALQGYEMLHRKEINDSELDTLFKALDIVPFWRDKLKAISFAPFTRVDVRRMHKLGVLSDEQLKVAYQDIGYDDWKSDKMVEWTIAYNNLGGDDDVTTTRDLTRSLIIRAFNVGLFKPDEAIFELTELGFSQEDSELIISISEVNISLDSIPEKQKDNVKRIERIVTYGVTTGILPSDEAKTELQNLGFTDGQAQSEIDFLNWERFLSLRELMIKNIGGKYKGYVINQLETLQLLRANGFEQTEIQQLITQWDIERDDRNRLPTKKELEEMVLKEVIGFGQYVDYMRGHGYDDKIIGHFLELLFT